MAFSSTNRMSNSTPGVQFGTVTLTDTAGSSSGLQFGPVDTITIQAALTGTAGTTTVECSNNGSTWAGLPTAVTFTASGVKTVPADSLGFRFYRLTLAGGDATSDHTFTVHATNRRHARAT